MVTIQKPERFWRWLAVQDYSIPKTTENFKPPSLTDSPVFLKPITYATAFSKGYTAATLLMIRKTILKLREAKKIISRSIMTEKFRGPYKCVSLLQFFKYRR